MPFLRCAAILLLISATVLLTGARNPQTKLRAAPANPETHSVAVRLLDEALMRLDAEHVQWLDTRLWQKGRLGRYDFEAEGRFLAGPDNQSRLEITTRHGRAVSTSLTVSDGLTIWQGNRPQDGPWSGLIRVKANQAFQSPQPAVTPSSSCENLLSHSYVAVVPLLRSLRSEAQWSRLEHVRRVDHVFVRLTGNLSNETGSAINSKNPLWPTGIPRRCRLYLDPATLWPHRIEWWGPDGSIRSDSLILQMEFRDPIINQPLSAEQCLREFSFPLPENQMFEESPEAIQRIRRFLAQPVSGN